MKLKILRITKKRKTLQSKLKQDNSAHKTGEQAAKTLAKLSLGNKCNIM